MIERETNLAIIWFNPRQEIIPKKNKLWRIKFRGDDHHRAGIFQLLIGRAGKLKISNIHSRSYCFETILIQKKWWKFPRGVCFRSISPSENYHQTNNRAPASSTSASGYDIIFNNDVFFFRDSNIPHLQQTRTKNGRIH